MTLSKEQRQLAGLEPVRQSMFLSSGSLRVARPGAKEVNEVIGWGWNTQADKRDRAIAYADKERSAKIMSRLKREFPHYSLDDMHGILSKHVRELGQDARKLKKRWVALAIAAEKEDAKKRDTSGLPEDRELKVPVVEGQSSNSVIPGISKWGMFAGGIGAAEGKHAYTWTMDYGTYHIDPFTTKWGRHAGYLVRFSSSGKNQPAKLSGGLWHDLGKVRSPAEGVKKAREFHNSIKEDRSNRRCVTPGLSGQMELTEGKSRGAFSISRPISVPKYDDPLHDGYTEDEVLSEARKGFSRVNATQISRRACLSEADVWPRDVKIVSKKWQERPGPARGGLSKPEYKLHAVVNAKGEKYEISTPWLVDKADEKNWVFAIQTELSKFLRKGKAGRILSAATGKMASVDDRKLAIV